MQVFDGFDIPILQKQCFLQLKTSFSMKPSCLFYLPDFLSLASAAPSQTSPKLPQDSPELPEALQSSEFDGWAAQLQRSGGVRGAPQTSPDLPRLPRTSPDIPRPPRTSPELPRPPRTCPELPRPPKTSPDLSGAPQTSPDFPRDLWETDVLNPWNINGNL